MDVGLKPILLKPVQFRPAMLSQTMRFPISANDAVLALIAEMKAKAADPLAGRLTAELCALTLENVLPMLRVDELRHGDDARE